MCLGRGRGVLLSVSSTLLILIIAAILLRLAFGRLPTPGLHLDFGGLQWWSKLVEFCYGCIK